MTQRLSYIDRMIDSLTKHTSSYYKISPESAARLYLMSALKQVESYTKKKSHHCRYCSDDFDPMVDCEENGMGPLDPRC